MKMVTVKKLAIQIRKSAILCNRRSSISKTYNILTDAMWIDPVAIAREKSAPD